MPHNIIISGSRTITNIETIFNILKSEVKRILLEQISRDLQFILGGAKGVDTIAQEFCELHKIATKIILPDWGLKGLSAGMQRNAKMLVGANEAIIIWDGISKGTKNMIDLCGKNGIKFALHRVEIN